MKQIPRQVVFYGVGVAVHYLIDSAGPRCCLTATASEGCLWAAALGFPHTTQDRIGPEVALLACNARTISPNGHGSSTNLRDVSRGVTAAFHRKEQPE